MVGVLGLLGLGAWLGLYVLVQGPPAPGLGVRTGTVVLDRDGRLLRPFTVDGGRWRLPLALAEVDPRFIRLLLAIEDRRFHDHPGVDPLALARAGGQLLTRGHIVSGGSTLTMQLARLLEGGPTRSAGGKFRQALSALALERTADKTAILTAYLTVAPYGGNLEGLRAGSLAWLGKEPRRLSDAEAALLVALPQAPEARRPDRDPAAARRARDRVLARARALGLLDPQAHAAALREPVPERRRPFPMLAPHLAVRLVQAAPGRSVLRTTLDAGLQARLETLAAERAAAIDPRVSAALVVADHGTGEVLAAVGSAGLFAGERAGHVDMTRALRSPGSTLKPLIYGLAFEAGIAHPESLIEDRPTAFAGYVPGNFDRSFQGTVTVRRALEYSLNVPAVQLLEAVGPARLIARMRRAGAEPVLAEGAPPGLAIGLGGLGVSLFDLVRLYGAIARGGERLDLHETPDRTTPVPGPPVLDGPAAWYLASILAAVPAPADAAPRGISYKTGTSYGYRDAWALGWDGRHVVGVWVGRPDGAPVPGLKGVEAAVPILLDAFARVGPRVPLPAAPPGVLTAATTALPPTLRHARVRDAGVGAAPPGPEIAFPPDGARLDLGLARAPQPVPGPVPGPGAPAPPAADGVDDGGARPGLVLKVRHGEPPFTWFVDGRPIGQEPYARTAEWHPSGPGYAALLVVDARGRASRVRVMVR